jgi:hypothetical protein
VSATNVSRAAESGREVLQTQLDESVYKVSIELCHAKSVCQRRAMVLAGSGLDQLIAEDKREPKSCLKREVNRLPSRP